MRLSEADWSWLESRTYPDSNSAMPLRIRITTIRFNKNVRTCYQLMLITLTDTCPVAHTVDTPVATLQPPRPHATSAHRSTVSNNNSMRIATVTLNRCSNQELDSIVSARTSEHNNNDKLRIDYSQWCISYIVNAQGDPNWDVLQHYIRFCDCV